MGSIGFLAGNASCGCCSPITNFGLKIPSRQSKSSPGFYSLHLFIMWQQEASSWLKRANRLRQKSVRSSSNLKKPQSWSTGVFFATSGIRFTAPFCCSPGVYFWKIPHPLYFLFPLFLPYFFISQLYPMKRSALPTLATSTSITWKEPGCSSHSYFRYLWSGKLDFASFCYI